MATNLLSDKAIRARPPVSKEQLLADGGGLFLRVRPSGKDWLFIYRSLGGRRKIGLGSYPSKSLASARIDASGFRQLIADGIDPVEERERRAVEERDAKAAALALPQTVGALFDAFEKQALSGRKDAGASTRRAFEKDVLPKLRDLSLKGFRRAHVVAILDAVVDRGAPRVAGLLLADIRQMCRWGVTREILANDVTAGLEKSAWRGESCERERALSEAEIKALARSLPGTLSDEAQAMVWIILGTACRVGEVSCARWSDVDLDAGTWTIPAENSKNAKPLTVALSAFALGHFRALRSRAVAAAEKAEREVSPWIFPARFRDGSVDPKSLGKQLADRQRAKAEPMSNRCTNSTALVLPGGPWRPHDLRRTAATLMASLGVQPNVIERCLNHTEPNRLVRIYQRHTWASEMAEAWRLLGDRLDLLTRADENVVTLARAA